MRREYTNLFPCRKTQFCDTLRPPFLKRKGGLTVIGKIPLYQRMIDIQRGIYFPLTKSTPRVMILSG